MTTFCKDCKHFIKNGQIWYDQFCGASERTKAVDPVTGEEGWIRRNDLGTVFVSDQQFDFARDVNKGYCLLFEGKGDENE